MNDHAPVSSLADTTATLASYDEVLYTALPFAQSHPSRLATMARLFGVEAPDVATCRVLELGCALGGNVIPMAVAMPDASFVGIDLSARQIEEGRRVVAALGLANIELRQADIAQVDASWGEFDYIVAHGIYSWVPAHIRERVLAICAGNLAPRGVAFVSYNAMPGWGMRGVIRDAMLYHARNASAATERIGLAREAMDFLARHSPADSAYSGVMRHVFDTLGGVSDAYIGHDFLEENNEAFYFHEFMDAAQAHQLEYLAEADFSSMVPQVAPELREALKRVAPDLIAREQYLDFVHNRSFRQTLLVHADVPLNRRLEPQAIFGFDIASPIQPASPAPSLAQGVSESFRMPSGADVSAVNAISKAALIELGTHWPLAIPFNELVTLARARLAPSRASVPHEQDARMLAIEMLQCYAAAAIELRVWSPAMDAMPPDRPVASPLARLQAQRESDVTNLLHRVIPMSPLSRAVLPLLDGTHGRDALIRILEARNIAGEFAVPSAPGGLRSIVDQTLAALAKTALLVSTPKS